ncbi:MAG: hypothetical protein GPJ13_08295 [Microcystis aeruginosa W11-06]|jgi:hypothetical protein|nr:hypothetical protein [Microcystis aeruginosa W11-03]NCR93764.1 hypothetical protein [Microcystis aeruginosa W11-06]
MQEATPPDVGGVGGPHPAPRKNFLPQTLNNQFLITGFSMTGNSDQRSLNFHSYSIAPACCNKETIA